jgi:TatD DNase family protein
MIDSHCHLADEVFEGDLELVIARARDAGLTSALTILAAGDDGEARRAERVAALWPDVRFAVGVHPHQAHTCPSPGRASALLEEALSRNGRIRAIGEIGLDYHYDYSPKDVQQAVFAEQIAFAVARDLPIVIHTREADDDTFAILEQQRAGRLRGVFHCFTGEVAAAQRAVALGFFVSFAGIVTFPRAQNVRDAVHVVPDAQLLAETDSPFLAPVPFRGKRNEPAWVTRVTEQLAEIRGSEREAIARIVTDNFVRLCGDDGSAAR